MNLTKTAHNIEKLVEKVEHLAPDLSDVRQADFDALRTDCAALLEEMLEIIHAEIEDAEERQEEDSGADK